MHKKMYFLNSSVITYVLLFEVIIFRKTLNDNKLASNTKWNMQQALTVSRLIKQIRQQVWYPYTDTFETLNLYVECFSKITNR